MNSCRKNLRVPRGGAFNLPKTQYSDDTRVLLKEMMEECQLSMLKRRELDRFIASGEPLPALQPRGTSMQFLNNKNIPSHPALTRRRSRDAIIQSGAYQKQVFKPPFPGANNEQEKKKLQEIMAQGTTAPHSTDRSGKTLIPLKQQRDRFEELVDEVRERCQFLVDVAELGQEQRYRAHIEAEIAGKLRAMHAIDPRRSDLIRRQLYPATLSTRPTTQPLQLR